MSRRLRALIERMFHSRIAECTVLSVVGSRRITPHTLRISFAGKNLDAFATDENLHLKLLLPPEGAPRDRWLTAVRDGRARLRGGSVDPVIRKYTIRTVDAAAGHIDIDFVLHEHGGPGATWAVNAQAGDVVGAIGPGGRGIAASDWYLLAGDETGLPAIGRILESLPADAQGVVLVEIDQPEVEQRLAVPSGMTLRWLHRAGATAGTTNLLMDAIASTDIPSEEQKVFVWVAAEFDAIRTIRAYLRRNRKLDKYQHLAVAYWRRGTAD